MSPLNLNRIVNAIDILCAIAIASIFWGHYSLPSSLISIIWETRLPIIFIYLLTRQQDILFNKPRLMTIVLTSLIALLLLKIGALTDQIVFSYFAVLTQIASMIFVRIPKHL